MAAPTNLYFLNKNYTMIPDDGEGPLVHVKYGSYIIPVRWGIILRNLKKNFWL